MACHPTGFLLALCALLPFFCHTSRIRARNVSKAVTRKDEIEIDPSTFLGNVFYVHSYSKAQNDWYCYKVKVGDKVEQRINGVKNGTDFSNEACEKTWHTDKDLGTYSETIQESGATKHVYIGGTKDDGCQTKDKTRSTVLSMAVDESKEQIVIDVEEEAGSACFYKAFLSGPIAKLQVEKEMVVPPAVANGKVFIRLGKSKAQDGSCFCYKVVVGVKIEQLSKSRDCSTTHKRCEEIFNSGIDDKNLVLVGTLASEEPMSQTYKKGTEDDACQTGTAKQREAKLELKSDKEAEEVRVEIAEPTRCSYEVTVAGPLAALHD